MTGLTEAGTSPALAGRTALVTGAGQGIGRGISLALARAGARVAVSGRTASKLQDVADEITAGSGEAMPVVLDVTDADSIDAGVERVIGELGRLQVLVHAAHHEHRAGSLLDTEDAEVEQHWRSGPLAALRLMRACHPQLVGGGAIVNLGSGAQFRPQGYGVYAASKEALWTITRTAAVEWGPDGIRANLIVPHATSPSMERDLADTDRRAATLRSIPLGRFGTPEEVGRVAVFLASDESAYVTGQLVAVDGGMTHHR